MFQVSLLGQLDFETRILQFQVFEMICFEGEKVHVATNCNEI
jgi:hypothetical protein